MSDLISQLAIPHPASSLYFAHRTAPAQQRTALRALYTLHKKWREAAVYNDQHQAVTTLNWWHHELEKIKTGEISHPALIALKPWLTLTDNKDEPNTFFNALQGLLHGHMHWHHLTRIENLESLEPTIDAIGGLFIQAWLLILGAQSTTEFALTAGRALWWIDQTRHVGHGFTPSRMWLPMDWLKRINLPAHIVLKKNQPFEQRAQHGAGLMALLLEQSQTAFLAYQTQYSTLNKVNQKQIKSLHALLKMRGLLLSEISQRPQDVWKGLVTASPRKKWWAALSA